MAREPNVKAMYALLYELYAKQEGVEIAYKFDDEDEVRFANKNKQIKLSYAEREKLFYERLREREQRNTQIPS